MKTMCKLYSFFVTLVSLSLTACFVDSFAPLSALAVGPAATTAGTCSTTQLWMSSAPPSRRDVLKSTGTKAATAAAACLWIHPNVAQAVFDSPITTQSAANKANESYQGVYFDPKHPDGYRVLVKESANKATMTLSDGGPQGGGGAEPKTFRDISVRVDNDSEFVFDFGFKNGPKDIKGKLSPDKQSITFEDGNTWTKNYYKYDGIYKVTSGGDPSLSKDAYRVLRKNGPEILLELHDAGKDTIFVDGSVGTLFSIPTCSLTFYFGGKKQDAAGASANEYSFVDALYDFQRGNDVSQASTSNNNDGTVIGQLSLQDRNTVFPYGTITFPDKTVWTRI